MIEVDGRYWHCNLERKPFGAYERKANDKYNNELAKRKGFKIIRIWDDEVEKIWRYTDEEIEKCLEK